MREEDKNKYIERYTGRLSLYGYSPETLGWGKNGRQDLRFSVLCQHIIDNPGCSVLDIGCGFADLYGWLINKNWKGKYVGIDIVPSLLEVAKERNPDAELYNYDIQQALELGSFDYVVASGIFNAKLIDTDNRQHIIDSLATMHNICTEMVCADFMSTYVDFQKEGSWHTDPAWLMSNIQKISKRFILRYDYMPFEFSLFLFKNDSVNETHTFNI